MENHESVSSEGAAELPAGPGQPLVNWSGKDVLLITAGAILIFITGFIGILVFARGTQAGIPTEGNPTILLSILLVALEGVALTASVYFLGLRRRGLSWASIGLGFLSSGWLVTSVIIGLAVIPLSGLVALAIQRLLGRPLENPQLPFLAPDGFTWTGFIGMFLLGGIVAPIAEELVFRGVLYQWLRGRWGFWGAAIISSLIFGAIHGEVSVAGAAAVLGLILAWVYERSRSLWPAILVHAINNSLKIAALYALLATGMTLPGV